jgi:hypothetical protein
MSSLARLRLGPLSSAKLWSAIGPEVRRLAGRAVLGRAWGGDALRSRVDRAIADAMRFRPAAVRRLPVDKRVDYLARSVRPSDALASELLVALHLGYRRPMLAAFLDELGIPHRDGLIDQGHRPRPPDPHSLRRAVRHIAARFPTDEVELYLTSLIAMDPELWGGIGSLLEEAARGGSSEESRS